MLHTCSGFILREKKMPIRLINYFHPPAAWTVCLSVCLIGVGAGPVGTVLTGPLFFHQDNIFNKFIRPITIIINQLIKLIIFVYAHSAQDTLVSQALVTVWEETCS